MSLRFNSLYRVLCVLVAAHSASAVSGVPPQVEPSDCRPRDADSTCATALVGAPVPAPTPIRKDVLLYDGPLGGVPANGYAYWGFDFFAGETGTPSAVRPDEFINRSRVPVTITLSFDIPTSHPCKQDCLPGLEFLVGGGWDKYDPPYVVNAGTVSLTATFKPGQGFGWIIALWQSSHPRLAVTIPSGAMATMEDLGLPAHPEMAEAIAAVPTLCTCWDGSSAVCSYGSYFSNGLLGPWAQNQGNYSRAGAFTQCPGGGGP